MHTPRASADHAAGLSRRALRTYVVASVRMPAYAVPVRADTNPVQT